MSGAHHVRGQRREEIAVLVLGGIVVLALIVAGVDVAVRGLSPEPPPAPVAATRDPMVVELAQVAVVERPDLVTLATPSGPARVQVAGLLSPTGRECGAAEALEHARDRLAGQTVTVVPDPTQAGRTPPVVHLVLPSQLSYTDDALMDGMAMAGPGQYAAVFRDEQAEAVADGTGLWSSCWAGRR